MTPQFVEIVFQRTKFHSEFNLSKTHHACIMLHSRSTSNLDLLTQSRVTTMALFNPLKTSPEYTRAGVYRKCM